MGEIRYRQDCGGRLTNAFHDSYHPDLATPGLPGPVENLVGVATEVITSAFECSEWRWVRAW